MIHQALCIISKPLINSNWNYSTEMLNSGQNWLFVLCDLEIWRMTLKINRTPTSIFEHHFKEFKLEWRSGNAQFVSKSAIFLAAWPRIFEIWRMTLINKRGTLPYHIKHCASFQSHRWIQTGATVRKRPIEVEIGDFLSRVTLKFDWWPWKTIGHLFYATSSFVHHFIAICEFKLELQSGNTLCLKIDDLF